MRHIFVNCREPALCQSPAFTNALVFMSMLVDLASLHTTVSGGVPPVCLMMCQNLLDVPLLVLFA